MVKNVPAAKQNLTLPNAETTKINTQKADVTYVRPDIDLLHAAHISEGADGVCDSVHFSESLLMNTIMNNSHDTIYVKDLSSNFVMTSRAHARLFNLSDPREMIGKCDFDYLPLDFAQRALFDEQEIIRTGKPIIGQIERLDEASGKITWFSASKYPLYDAHDRIIGTWGTSREITKLKQVEEALALANEELKNLSRIDELSGLYNRRYFYELLNSAVQKKDDRAEAGLSDSFCLVTLDIDHFKAVNDTHGHLDGDEAIRHIAGLLRNNCRSTDTVFRIGGDEYVILLMGTSLHTAREQAERIRKIAESTPLFLRGKPYQITVSLGVACYDDHSDINEFVREADDRLYCSKKRGRNCVT